METVTRQIEMCVSNEFEQKALLEFIMNCLDGKRNQQICVPYGTGANGKSMLILLLKRVFGDTMAYSPSSNIFGKCREKYGDPSDLFQMCKKYNLIVSQESSEKDINVARLCQYLSNDTLYNCQLNEQMELTQVESPEQNISNMIIVTNDLTPFTSSDQIKRRCLFIKFDKVFDNTNRKSFEKLTKENP